MIRLFSAFILVLANGILFLCCSSSNDSGTHDNTVIIDSDSNISLVLEHQPELDAYRNSITDLVTDANLSIQSLMPIDNVTIRVFADKNQSIPEIGIGGYNPSKNEVLIYVDTDFPDLEASIAAELPAMIAHEMHHAKRRRSAGYGNSLLEAVISEGLADHFSMEATNIQTPRWSKAIQGQQLQDFIETASETWNNSNYNHPKWFFGTTAEVPRWTGYSIGFELVKNYLETNDNSKPSNLHDEPANSFLP